MFSATMKKMTGKIMVISSCGSEEEAARIATHLVSEKVAACVSMIPRVRSFYRWENKLEDSAEVLLVIKSSRELFDRLRRELESVHSYHVPEVLAMPVVDGAPNYLAWMDGELAR
jgi:periplasmic divalent cation tolerance protein